MQEQLNEVCRSVHSRTSVESSAECACLRITIHWLYVYTQLTFPSSSSFITSCAKLAVGLVRTTTRTRFPLALDIALASKSVTMATLQNSKTSAPFWWALFKTTSLMSVLFGQLIARLKLASGPSEREGEQTCSYRTTVMPLSCTRNRSSQSRECLHSCTLYMYMYVCLPPSRYSFLCSHSPTCVHLPAAR